MKIKKIALHIFLIALISLLFSWCTYLYISKYMYQITITADVKSTSEASIQYYYEEFPSQEYNEIHSAVVHITGDVTYHTYKATFKDTSEIVSLRMDFGTRSNEVYEFKNIILSSLGTKKNITSILTVGSANDVILEAIPDGSYKIITTGPDPWLSCIYEFKSNKELSKVIFVILFVIYSLLSILYVEIGKKYWKKIFHMLKSLYTYRKLLWKMAVNDFHKKYAGSSFGIAWAFIQPLMTILVFWFVFQIGFRNSPVSDIPFALWLTGGFVPWFFFQDAWASATYALEEYNYLVKKIAFRMELIPFIKIISSFFVHLAFCAFLFLLSILYGTKPSFYLLQLPYYLVCVLALTIGLSYLTASINVFFKDMGQIIGILLQFGMWLTPIMWDYHVLPPVLKTIFKVNPMFYIIEGYRDTFINHVLITEHLDTGICFWLITLFLCKFSINLFQSSKSHFADVL